MQLSLYFMHLIQQGLKKLLKTYHLQKLTLLVAVRLQIIFIAKQSNCLFCQNVTVLCDMRLTEILKIGIIHEKPRIKNCAYT